LECALRNTPPLCMSTCHLASVYFLSIFHYAATTEIYTLSLHDALPIWNCPPEGVNALPPSITVGAHMLHAVGLAWAARLQRQDRDRKSTRLNSSHEWISYAVFCLKKKKDKQKILKERTSLSESETNETR